MVLLEETQNLLFLANNLTDLNLIEDCVSELLYPLIRTTKLVPILKSYS